MNQAAEGRKRRREREPEDHEAIFELLHALIKAFKTTIKGATFITKTISGIGEPQQGELHGCKFTIG